MRTALVALALLGCTERDDDPGSDTDATDPGADPSAAPIEPYDPLGWVDPMIATGGEGAEIANVNPGATLPNGMTLVGPDTRNEAGGAAPYFHCAGYWHNDDHIGHFSMTHAHGMGVPDYGAIPFMFRDGWDPAYTAPAGRIAPFSHDEEWARPGSYSVILQDQDVRVDIAATLRGAHVRITFPEGAEPVAIFDLGATLTSHESSVQVADARAAWAPDDPSFGGFQRLRGSYSGRFGGLMTHFAGVADPPPVGGGAWDDPDAPVEGLTEAEGARSGFYLRFPEGTTQVDLRLAISYVDEEGARKNLDAELPDTDLDARVAEAEAAWRAMLERVRVRGGTDAQRTIFHTALYHALIMPSRQDDVDGRYRGMDQQIHVADGPHYSDLSLWDTFRTLHPFYIVAWPELQLDVNRSIVRMIEDGGYLPKWPLAHGYTGGMVGSPAIQVLAESWLKGLRDFDVDTAFQASLRTATSRVPEAGRGGIEHYVEHGWVPIEDGSGSVSDTLEYAWNDHALLLWAEALGDEDAAATLRPQADNWREHWYPEAGFNTGRYADGTFAWNFDAHRYEDRWVEWYVEGNAWHYLWYTPYDVPGMIGQQHDGDVDAFVARHRDYWERVFAEPDDRLPDTYYWHGNEPVMHYAFLGALIDHPDLTADAARWVMAHRYADDPVGLDGNDDAGTLSAWYLLASIGIFPVAGTDVWAWSPPLWERVEIDRPGGDPFVLRAPGTSEARRYLAGWRVDGNPLPHAHVTHDVLFGGGDVVMELVDAPGAFVPAE